MENFQLLHYLLQSSRKPFVFQSGISSVPFSCFLFDLKEFPETRNNFDYRDNFAHRTLYLRLGSIGILVAFDMGMQQLEGAHYFPKYQAAKLHPLQFAELGAEFFLKASKRNRSPQVIFSDSTDAVYFSVLAGGLSNQPPFLDATMEERAELVAIFTSRTPDQIYADGGNKTWLINDAGEIADIPI